MAIGIGVDIGGSHISSAAVNLQRNEILPETYFSSQVDNKASKEKIYQTWSRVINKSLEQLHRGKPLGIGIAIPGPFNYREGIALFERNEKYESLYRASVLSELPAYIKYNLPLRFLNDATSFGVGGAMVDGPANTKRIVAITLGTGFGAAFLKGHIPVVKNEAVPEDGCLWDKSFLTGIADDFFSSRWFLSRYAELTADNDARGVKDIVDNPNFDSSLLFGEFAGNLSAFLLPYLKTFRADLLVLGGNISKSSHLFLPHVQKIWKENNIELPVKTINNTEEAVIIGSSSLFTSDFWKKIRRILPDK